MTIQLFTSRYSAGQAIERSGAVPVRISIGFPRFRLAYSLTESIPCLMPTRPMLKYSHEHYKTIYLGMLESLGVDFLRQEFERVAKAAGADKVVLLCYEDLRDGTKTCHRTMFANWWMEKTGEDVVELEPRVRNPADAQGRLL